MCRLVKSFLEEELYLYLLPDIPETTLSKFIEDEAKRKKVIELTKEIKITDSSDNVRAISFPPWWC